MKNSVFYRNTKNAKGNLYSNLVPEIGDFVAYMDGGKRTHFGIIDAVLKDNVVSLRVIKHGKVQHQNCHIRICRMIYRPSDEENHANI